MVKSCIAIEYHPFGTRQRADLGGLALFNEPADSFISGPRHEVKEMATVGITKALERYDRLKASIKNGAIRKHVKEERGYAGIAAIVGAAAAGAADAKYKADDGTSKKTIGIPTVGLVSGALAVAGLFDVVPGGIYVGMAGIGGICYLVGKTSHDHVASST